MKFQSNAIFNGTITANSVADAGTNTDKFLVLNSSGLVTYRTAAELYLDLGIGSLPAGYTSTLKHQVKAGVALTKGQAVYVTSADGTNMIVGKASNAAESTSSKTLGLIETSLSINGIGNVITEGLLAGLDTTGANAAGDPVWLGTNGDLIYGLSNKPSAPNHLVFIGVVTRVNQNNGEIFVKVQNGFELGELHNYAEGSVGNNQVITYESATSLYKPKSIATILGYTPADAARTISTTSPLQGGGDLSANRTLSITQATTSTSGYLSSTDWNTFNGKQAALSGIGFVKISGTTISYDNTAYLPLTGGTMYGNLLTTYPILSDSSISLSETGTITNYGNYTNFTGTPNGLKFIFGGGLTGAITFDTFGIIIKNHFGNTAAFAHSTSANLTFTLPSSSGTLALTSQIPSISGLVPTTRTITINGTTYDLSADRSWTVTSMVYPSAGIAVSTGTAWGTSITDNSSNWNTAYGWGNHASAGYVPGARTLTINGTTYDLTANRSWTIDSTTASTRVVQKYTSTAGQTVFTVTGGYTVGMVDVYVNGVKLDNATGVDFTATNGTSVTLTNALTANQIVEVYKFGSQFIPNNALRQVTTFTATAAQTTFTVNYSVGLVDVYYNGSCLAQSEYTATNGTSIVLATACQAGDIVVVYAYNYSVGAFSGIGGSGTTNYHAKFTGASTIGNSLIFDNGSAVGINTTSVSGTYGKLSVAGGISILDDNNAKLEIGRYSSGAANSYIKIGTNSASLRITNAADSADLFTFTNTGNLGIGTTSPVGYIMIAASVTTTATTSQQAYDYSRFRINTYNGSSVGLSIGNVNGNGTYLQTCYNEGTTAPMFFNPFGGNVIIGTSSDNNRKFQVSGQISTVGILSSSGNTGTATNGTNYGIINVTTKGVYYIFAQLPAGIGDSANYSAFMIVITDGSSARAVVTNNGARLTLSLSGTLVSVNQNSGGTQSGIDWTFFAQN